MKMRVIENGTSGVVPATQDISSTESDDSAEDVSTSVFMETNPLLEDERQTDHADLHHSLAASPTLGCASCQGKCTLQNAKLYVVCKFKNGLTKLKKVATVLRDRRVFLSITLYMMLSFGVIVGQEVSIQQLIMVHAYILLLLNVSVFHCTTHKLSLQQLFSLLMVTNHAHGGYSMDGNEIGTIFMAVAVCEFTWQVSFCTIILGS